MPPWDIQHPETPLATEGGKGRSYAIEMPRGQVLEVVTDVFGRFLHINELMPPLIPSDRVPGVTREHERQLREQEWAVAGKPIKLVYPRHYNAGDTFVAVGPDPARQGMTE